MLKKRHLLAVLVWQVLFAPLALAQTTAPEASPAQKIALVAAGMKNSRLALTTAEGVISYTESTPKQVYDVVRQVLPGLPRGTGDRVLATLPAESTLMTHVASWCLQGDNLAVFVQYDPKNIGLRYERLLVDGETAKVVRAEQDVAHKEYGTYYTGMVTPARDVSAQGLWSRQRALDPRYYAFFLGDTPVDALLSNERLHPVYLGNELVDGSQCDKIQITQPEGEEVTFVIDPDHGFLLRRVEERGPRNGQKALLRVRSVSKVVESNGKWLPQDCESKAFVTPQKEGEANENSASVVKRLQLSGFKADGPLRPESFILDWPVGTNVSDQIKGTHYAVTVLQP